MFCSGSSTSRVSSVVAGPARRRRSGTRRLVPRRDGVVQRGESVIRVNAGNDTAPGYLNRVSRSGLSGCMPGGSCRRVLPLYRCVPAVVSPGVRVAEPGRLSWFRFSGVNVLGASAPPVISTCRVNTPVRRGLGMSRSAPPNAYPKGCTAVPRAARPKAPYDRALVGVAVGVGAYRRQPRGIVGAARAAERPLTEWVNVIAFSDRTRHLSSQFDKSQMIAVMGKSRWSRTRPGRASPRGAGRLSPRNSSRTWARSSRTCRTLPISTTS